MNKIYAGEQTITDHFIKQTTQIKVSKTLNKSTKRTNMTMAFTDAGLVEVRSQYNAGTPFSSFQMLIKD